MENRKNALDVEIRFLEILRAAITDKQKIDKIVKTLEGCIDHTTKANDTKLKDGPAVWTVLKTSLSRSCEIGKKLLTGCKDYLTKLDETTTLIDVIWNSKEIQQKDMNQLIGLCKDSEASLKTVANHIATFQEALNETLGAHNNAVAYFRRMEKLASLSRTEKLIGSALKAIGTALVIAAAGGLVITGVGAVAGATIGAAGVANAGAAAGLTIGVELGAAAAVPLAGGAAGAQMALDAMLIYAQYQTRTHVLEEIQQMQETLEQIKTELIQANDSLRQAIELSPKCLGDVKLLDRVKERVQQQEERVLQQEEIVRQQEEIVRQQEEIKQKNEELEEANRKMAEMDIQLQQNQQRSNKR